MQQIDADCDGHDDEYVTHERPDIFDSIGLNPKEVNSETDIEQWINEIDEEAKQRVVCSDDGDRDNILENKEFAKRFLRLCEKLPLFSAISRKFFGPSALVGSSWSSETYFKNVKQLHGGAIPCSVDEFVKRDLQFSNGSVIKASQKYFSMHPEANNVNNCNASNANSAFDADSAIEDNDSSDEDFNNVEPISSPSNTSTTRSSDLVKCPACNSGNSPTDAHKCIVCDKAVHIFTECSVSIGDEEGYGERRKCIACHQAFLQNAKKQMTTAKEMNYKEKWQRKTKSKSSKYTKSAPNWGLVAINKKVKIARLVNGNLSKTLYTINRRKFKPSNTCGPDSAIQLIASAYAYNPTYRALIENENDGVFEVAKLLAKKYVHLYLFLNNTVEILFKIRFFHSAMI